jgi:hypothetical protein
MSNSPKLHNHLVKSALLSTKLYVSLKAGFSLINGVEEKPTRVLKAPES